MFKSSFSNIFIMDADFAGLVEKVNNFSKDGIFASDTLQILMNLNCLPGLGVAIRSYYTILWSMSYLCILMNAVTNPSWASKASFQVDGFGGAKLIRAKKMYQFRIIPVDQGVYFLNAESF